MLGSEDVSTLLGMKTVESLGDFLCIPTLNTGQLNPLFHTFAEFRLIVNSIVVRQSTDWLAANAQFSLDEDVDHVKFSWLSVVDPDIGYRDAKKR